MTNVTQGMQDIEDKVDALSLKLATTQGAVNDIATVATESAETLRALAVAVNELKSDAVPADFAVVVERVKAKASAALVIADAITEKATAIKDALAVAEDAADDSIPAAPVVTPDPVVEPAPVETVVVAEDEAEPVTAPVVDEPAVIEPAPVEAAPVPAEGAGDVVAVDGAVPAVENAPAPEA